MKLLVLSQVHSALQVHMDEETGIGRTDYGYISVYIFTDLVRQMRMLTDLLSTDARSYPSLLACEYYQGAWSFRTSSFQPPGIQQSGPSSHLLHLTCNHYHSPYHYLIPAAGDPLN